MNSLEIYEQLKILFPNAGCELNYRNNFELLVAVVLSAQTTDKKVNKVCEKLFSSFPDARALSHADPVDLLEIIRPLGLAKNKTNSLISLSRQIWLEYDMLVPDSYDELIKLSGVGRKTANVVLMEAFKIPTIPVDTHVERVSKRLALVSRNANVLGVEKQLQEVLPKDKWIEYHHLLIHFGRYFCKAIKPLCESCPFIKICQK